MQNSTRDNSTGPLASKVSQWAALVAIVGGGVAVFGGSIILPWKVAQNEGEIDRLRGEVRAVEVQIAHQNASLARIEENLRFIKEELDRTKGEN